MQTANIYENLAYKEDAPAITVLFQNEATKEVRIAFRDGQRMAEHQTAYPITVAMVEGNLDFGVNGEVLHLKKGDMLHLEGGVPHDLLAKSDCLVRLTLSKSDSVQRVRDVAAS